VNIQDAVRHWLAAVLYVEKVGEPSFDGVVLGLCGLVSVRVRGSGSLGDIELVEGFFDQLRSDGVVGFSLPLSRMRAGFSILRTELSYLAAARPPGGKAALRQGRQGMPAKPKKLRFR